MTRQEQQVFCVLGMGRSGTSLMVNLLSAMGVYFGNPESLSGYEPTEHRRFDDINRRIFEYLGGGGGDRPPLGLLRAGWEMSPALENLRKTASQIVEEEFPDAPLWGWKSPLNTMVLPFWRTVLPDLRCVVCVRNPVDVAISYKKFRRFPLVKSLHLWMLYTALALRHTKNLLHCVVFYEDLLTDTEAEVERICRLLMRTVPTGPILEQTRRVPRSDLWHNRLPLESLLLREDMPGLGKALYLLLKAKKITEERESLFQGADGLFDPLVEAIIEVYCKTVLSRRRRVFLRLGRIVRPMVPNRMKGSLISWRDRMIWQ